MIRSGHVFQRALMAAVLLAPASVPAVSQDSFPTRPVRIVLPMVPGGAMDVLARALGQTFQERTGQPFVVENKPGGNTVNAANACKNAPPDGYTICVLTTSSIAINPALYKTLSYQPEKDFEPVTQLIVGQAVIILHKSIPARNLAELVKYSQDNPDKLNYASLGVGGDSHLIIEWLKKKTGLKATHVPYRGGADALLAFEAGQVHFMYLLVGNLDLPDRIRSGEVTGLLVPGSARSPLIPNVPTFVEAGLPTFEWQTWFGIFAPAGVPKSAVAKLQSEIATIIHTPAFRDRLITPQGFVAVGNKPEEFKKLLERERLRGKELVAISGVQLE